ncbi:MAG: hypothetical protein AAFV80_04635 [Bacteroidota bacterium]
MKSTIRQSLLIFFFLVGCFSIGMAQDQDQEEAYRFKKEISFDFRMHTNGLAMGFNYGIIKSPRRSLMFQFAIASMKHPREYKKSVEAFPGPLSRSPKAYIFGKQNYFYGLHFTAGGKHYFSEGTSRRGVSVGFNYLIGPSLGITKPYYLDLIRFSDDLNTFEIVSERYTPENEDVFLNRGTIYGASGFTSGFSGIQVFPGGHAKLGLHFDWGVNDEFIKAIEFGVMVDAYTSKIPILVADDNRLLFMNLYLTLQLGKRS